jgi:hypothetical protein
MILWIFVFILINTIQKEGLFETTGEGKDIEVLP